VTLKTKRQNNAFSHGMDFDEIMRRVVRVKPEKSKKRAKRKIK
jgi:hypothetical protein